MEDQRWRRHRDGSHDVSGQRKTIRGVCCVEFSVFVRIALGKWGERCWLTECWCTLMAARIATQLILNPVNQAAGDSGTQVQLNARISQKVWLPGHDSNLRPFGLQKLNR